MTEILAFAPPSQAKLYVEIGPGHFVFYRDIADNVFAMNRRRHEAAALNGVSELCIGETMDIFGGIR